MSLKKNTIWNLVGSGSPLLAAAVCIPYTLKQLGTEGFGVLTLIWALIGYFSLFDFGTGRALTYEISKILPEGKDNKNFSTPVGPILTAGLLLTLITGLLGFVVIFTLSAPLAESWLKISPNWQDSTRTALQITAIGIIPATITSGLRGAMEGLGQFKESNLYKSLLGFGMFAIPAVSIHFHGPSLSRIAFYLVLMRVLITITCFVQLRFYFGIAQYEKSDNKTSTIAQNFRRLFSFGFWVTVTGIISPLMVFGDRFFISAMVGADQLSTYAIPQEGLMRVLMVPTAICGALLPILTNTKTKNKLYETYQINYLRMAKIMGCLCVLAAILVVPILSIWISPAFAANASIIAFILILGTFINGIALVPYTLLHSLGKTKVTAQFHIAELFIYLAIMYFLTIHFGLYGAAIAWVIRVYLDWILLHFAGKRALATANIGFAN
ncbi:flippase [Undibacterium flavidum]|uniref:Flippase n=1 Tax=Undibacterium flavidum TaxID=2762297 RepID=A0ABR6Y6J6_9BURK|nr:flippase [Undibacterium flavidum]MBC3872198.1 flippase [Undibacterium flavidum]